MGKGISDGEEHRALLEECRTAPAGVPLQVLVTDGSSESEDYLLPYPCQLTPDGWVNAATGSRLEVRPTRWKPFVETRRAKK